MERLTPREQQVARLLAEGKRQKEISRLLMISRRTVEAHCNNAKRKIGARTTFELAVKTAVEVQGE